MNLIKQSDFARILNISRQAVSFAVKNNTIPSVPSGKRKLIDLDDDEVKKYMNAENPQRHTPQLNEKKGVTQGEKNIQKKTNNDSRGKAEACGKKKKQQISIPGNGQGEYFDKTKHLEKYLIARAEKEAENAIKAKLINAKIRGEMLVREIVYDTIFLYLDKLHSNLERLADSYLSDTGAMIVTAGAVTPAIRSIWRNEVLKQIDDTKKRCMEKIKEIEREQAG